MMGNIKVRIMVHHVNSKWPNKSYRELSPFSIRNYLMKKFEVSKYMAEQATKILYKDEDKD
jgi:hypothetical protein